MEGYLKHNKQLVGKVILGLYCSNYQTAKFAGTKVYRQPVLIAAFKI